MSKKATKKKTTAPARTETGQPLISVCMIVRDEDENLDRCLRSLRTLADEIVIVDTGSKDKTVEIARGHGAKVSFFSWCDDFAAARNAALEKAKGQWILQMDADEELRTSNVSQFRQSLAAAPASCWGYFLPVRCQIVRNGQPAHTLGHRLLLYRNRSDMRYHGRIHEEIRYTGSQIGPKYQFREDPVIEHFGYLPSHMESKAKFERNLRLLRLALAEAPDDPFNLYNLGAQYYSIGNSTEAAPPLRRAIQLSKGRNESFLLNAYSFLIGSLSRSGDGDQVLYYINEAERSGLILSSDFYCNAGEGLRLAGKNDLALKYFQKAIEAGSTRVVGESDPGSYTWLPRRGLGMVYQNDGDFEHALQCYEEAAAFDMHDPELYVRIVQMHVELRDSERALRSMAAALQKETLSEESCLILLGICADLTAVNLLAQDSLPTLNDCAIKLIQHVSPTAENGGQLAVVCHKFGQYESGIAAANATLAERDDFVAFLNRGLCHFALARYQEAAADFEVAENMEAKGEHIVANLFEDTGTTENRGRNGRLSLPKVVAYLHNQQATLPWISPDAGNDLAFVQEQWDLPRRFPNDTRLDAVIVALKRWHVESTLSCPEAGDQPTGTAVPDAITDQVIPLASIIVSTHNQEDALKRCIQAIIENTPEDLYEVVIVDQGSTDGTKDFLDLLAGDVKIGFEEPGASLAAACSMGAKLSSGRYLVFLPSHCEPGAGWLESLLITAEDHPGAMLVGPNLRTREGTPAVPLDLGLATDPRWSEDWGKVVQETTLDSASAVSYLSGVGLLILRAFWEAAGGYDSRYEGPEFPVIDLCFAARQTGGQVYFQPLAQIGIEISQLSSVERERFARDRERFVQKWANHRSRANSSATRFGEGENPDIAAEPSPNKTHEANSPSANLYYAFSRPEVQNLVPPTARRILDVGCASGELGRSLKMRQQCEVTGIEYVPAVAEKARSVLDRVYTGDVLQIASTLPRDYFDCIVMADVLEHLVDPKATLAALLQSLRAGGRFVLSIPNIRHWSAMRDLLEGRWDYADAGLFDHTHLRFFTRASVERLLRSAGLRPILKGTTSVAFEPIPPAVVTALKEAGLNTATLAEESQAYQFLYVGEPLAVSKPMPLTSIIILTRNQLEHTKLCLSSLERHTAEPYELILVDNGSTDGTQSFLKSYVATHDNVHLIANAANRGFAAGNNQGLAVAQGEYVVLLNNDTAVTAGWLRHLLDVFQRFPKAGIVGPMSNYVTGPQLVPNPNYKTLAEMEDFAIRWAAENERATAPSLRLVGFCLMIRRTVVEKIGGLDERFGNGNFEDDDYCLRSALSGFDNLVAQDVFVHHTGGRTFQGEGIDYRKSMLGNWKLFKAKWGIPASTTLEQGYRLPDRVRDVKTLFVPLPKETTADEPQKGRSLPVKV